MSGFSRRPVVPMNVRCRTRRSRTAFSAGAATTQSEAVALAAAALRAAALVRFSPDPVIGFTPDGVITEWNPAAERMYGHTAEQALGQSVDLIVPPELSTDRPLRPGPRRRDDRRAGHAEHDEDRRADRRLDLDVADRRRPRRGRRRGGLHPRHRRAGARRRAPAPQRDAADRGPGADVDRQLGVGPDHRRGLLVAGALSHPRPRSGPGRAELRRLPGVRPSGGSRGGRAATTRRWSRPARATMHTSRMLGSDGVLRITQSRTRATTDADGRVVRLNGTTQDVSELVHANERLERANRRNEALLNSAGDGIYGIDRDGMTTFANPVAARLTGHAVEHLVGRSRHDTFRHTRPDGTHLRRARLPGVGVAGRRHRASLRRRRLLAQGRLELSGRVHEHADLRAGRRRRRRRGLQGHQRAPRPRAREGRLRRVDLARAAHAADVDPRLPRALRRRGERAADRPAAALPGRRRSQRRSPPARRGRPAARRAGRRRRGRARARATSTSPGCCATASRSPLRSPTANGLELVAAAHRDAGAARATARGSGRSSTTSSPTPSSSRPPAAA